MTGTHPKPEPERGIHMLPEVLELLDTLRAGTVPEGPDHIFIAVSVSEHAVLIPPGADVTVVANCGGG